MERCVIRAEASRALAGGREAILLVMRAYFEKPRTTEVPLRFPGATAGSPGHAADPSHCHVVVRKTDGDAT